MIVDPKLTKEVSSYLTLQQEESTRKTISDKGLTFTLCDRDLSSNKRGHYFSSFNLPTSADDFSTASTLSKLFPELQQLNVDRIVMVPIPASGYSESIDGRSIKFSVPQNSSAGSSQTTMSSITVYSSTYTSDKILKSESSPLLGDNVVFLFSDTINRPFTGHTIDELGILTSHASNTTWEPDTTNFLKRPSAVSYQEVRRALALSGVGTDLRTNTLFSVPVGGLSYVDGLNFYKYDVPVGVFYTDKGIAILSHSAITNNIPWASGFTSVLNAAYVEDSTVASKYAIYFTGTTSAGDKAAQIVFDDLDTSFKTTAVCVAMPREFYVSNNNTWNRSLVISDINNQSGIINVSPVYATQVGLYNSCGELIAVAVLDRPVSKTYSNVLTFSIDLEM